MEKALRPAGVLTGMPARSMSNVPESAVYGGPKPQSPWKRVTLRHLQLKHDQGQPISMVTAYDYPSAVHVDMAGIDILLVGDSVGMVVHGHDTTLPVTMDDIILHCRAVARGATRPLLAVGSAVRVLKEGLMDAVKIEGGGPARVAAVRAVSEAGIAVMGHVGLTPQAISSLGGFRPQGRSAASALQVLEHALAVEAAGCFGMVLECVPSPVAAAVTAAVRVPVIGIGAGPNCSGQVLVYHDLLGFMQHPHHAKVTPKFCKQYADVGAAIQEGLTKFREEVSESSFPSPAHTPYRIDDRETDAFMKELERRGLGQAASAAGRAAGEDKSAGAPAFQTPSD
eukprot:jgi/Mesen1/10131/ME000075S09633